MTTPPKSGARGLGSEGVEDYGAMQVREKVTDDRMVSISSRYVNMELTCPVCLRLLHKTEIVMECLHRFCGECIQKCLRVGKNECPSCRIHVPSRRSLRPDPNFDALIARIYPDIDAFERYEERCIAAFHKNRPKTVGVPVQQRPVPRRSFSSPRAPRTTTPSAPPSSRPAPATTGTKRTAPQRSSSSSIKRGRPAVSQAPPTTVNFVLRVHPNETGVSGLEREYLETSDQLKVQHLKKFLGLKLKYSPMDDFELLIALDHQIVVLNENLTLAQIIEHFHQPKILPSDSNFVLHYRLARPTGF